MRSTAAAVSLEGANDGFGASGRATTNSRALRVPEAGRFPLVHGRGLVGDRNDAGQILEVRDDALRTTILERLVASEALARVRLPSGESIKALLRRGDDAGEIALVVETTDVDFGVRQLVSVEAELHGSQFILQGVVTINDRGHLVARSIRIFSLGRRLCERVEVVDGAAVAEWADPVDPRRRVSARIVDLSPRGMGVVILPGSTRLLPTPPFSLKLKVGDVVVEARAEVRRSTTLPDGSWSLGLRLRPLYDADVTRLAKLCQGFRCPNLVTRSEVELPAVVDLMRASGYMDLRDGMAPGADWHHPPGTESLTVDTVYRCDNGSLLGHFSSLRTYPRTWILHQLATVGLRRGKIAYSLYVHVIDWITALAGDEGFAIAYFNQAKPWHQAMFGAFVRWVGTDSLTTIASLDRLEPISGLPDQALSPSVQVRVATESDRPFAVDLARTHLPKLVADALYLHEDSISTSNLCDAHAVAGLERQRETVLVEAEGGILGVAICETGARWLSLFNILNMAIVFFPESMNPELARAAQAALLAAVRRFYSAKGIEDPLIVTPQGNVKSPEAVGLRIAESMGCWVASIEGIKQWRNFIHFEMGELARTRSRPPRIKTTERNVA
jgi:hypothetical protein